MKALIGLLIVLSFSAMAQDTMKGYIGNGSVDGYIGTRLGNTNPLVSQLNQMKKSSLNLKKFDKQ